MTRTASLLVVGLAIASTACGRGSEPLGKGKQGASQALFHAMRPATAEPSDPTGQSGPSSVKGRSSGTATVNYEVSVTGSTVTVRRDIKYVDFSEDGKTFYNGSLAVDLLVQTGATTLVKYAAKGRITLSGEVNDYLDSDVAIEVDSAALSSSTGTAHVKLAGQVTTSAGVYQYADEAFDFDIAAGLPGQTTP